MNNVKLTDLRYPELNINLVTFEFSISSLNFRRTGTPIEIKNAILRIISNYKELVKEYNKKFKAIKPDPSGKPSQVEERLDTYENIYEQLPLALKEYLRLAKSIKLSMK